MPKPSVLSILAQKRGISIEALIADALDREGTAEQASKALGISHNVIHVWARKNGYRIVRDCRSRLVAR